MQSVTVRMRYNVIVYLQLDRSALSPRAAARAVSLTGRLHYLLASGSISSVHVLLIIQQTHLIYNMSLNVKCSVSNAKLHVLCKDYSAPACKSNSKRVRRSAESPPENI